MATKTKELVSENVLGEKIGSIINYDDNEYVVVDKYHYLNKNLYNQTIKMDGYEVSQIIKVEYVDDEREGRGNILKFDNGPGGIIDRLKLRKIDPNYEFTDFLKTYGEIYIEEWLQPFIPKHILEWLWKNEPAYTGAEFLLRFKDNVELRAIAMRFVGPGAVMQCFNSKMISENKIPKKFPMRVPKQGTNINQTYKDANDLLSHYEIVTYEKDEIYKLHKIDKSELGNMRDAIDIYVVEMVCPSTDRVYYQFVDYDNLEQKTALGAVAWTMSISVDEYINNIGLEA